MIRLALLAAATIAQRVSITLCGLVELSYAQRIEHAPGPWHIGPGEHHLHDLLYAVDGEAEHARVYSPQRIGPFVVVVEWAPDGGGTTRVFDARSEQPDATVLCALRDAQARADEADMQEIIDWTRGAR